jgi:hypothetical protein
MRSLKGLAAAAAWFTLGSAIPATLLYPVVLWTAKHTNVLSDALTRSYILSVALLFLPTGFPVDMIYRRFFRDWRKRRM